MQPDPPAAPGLTGEAARRWAAVQPASGDALICIGDAPDRAELVAGLRSLADYLAADPSVPVPPYGWRVAVYAEGTDSEQFAQVDLVAEITAEQPADRRAATGHHSVQRSFGPVSYEFTAISERRMTQYRAGMSYAASVVPDTPPGPPACLAAEAFPGQTDAFPRCRSTRPGRRSPERIPRCAPRRGDAMTIARACPFSAGVRARLAGRAPVAGCWLRADLGEKDR